MRIFNISELELATSTNIDPSTLNKILNSKTTNPRIETVSSLSKFFNVDIDSLINEAKQNQNTYNQSNTANILKKLIISKNNPSISSLANKIGISKSILSNILNNKTKKLNVSTVNKITKYFNIEPQKLLNECVDEDKMLSQHNIIQLSTIPLIEIVDAFNHINHQNTNILKYIKIPYLNDIKNVFAIKITEDIYEPDFTKHCYLIITRQEPIHNGFVIVKLDEQAQICKYLYYDNIVNLQNIITMANIILTKTEFNKIFIGTVYQTIMNLSI